MCQLTDVDGRRAIRRKKGMWHSGFGKHAGGQLGQVCELWTRWRQVFVELEVEEESGLVALAKAGWWKVVVQLAW